MALRVKKKAQIAVRPDPRAVSPSKWITFKPQPIYVQSGGLVFMHVALFSIDEPSWHWSAQLGSPMQKQCSESSVARCADLSARVRNCADFQLKKSQFLVISAQIFISMLNTWTDLNSYILHILMSYCRRSDNVTSGVLVCLVSRSRM